MVPRRDNRQTLRERFAVRIGTIPSIATANICKIRPVVNETDSYKHIQGPI